MATTKSIAPARPIPAEEDPKSPYEGLYHLLRRCVHGHDTDIDSVCHYQDVFGHSCEEDLEKAAEGEYKEVFYRLYDEAYGTVQMINFYSKHSAYVRNLRERVEDLECDVEEAKAETERQRELKKSRDNDLADAAKRIEELKAENRKLVDDNAKIADAVTKLAQDLIKHKAMLLDMQQEAKK